MVNREIKHFYPSKGWHLPVNKWDYWSGFKKMGFYEPSNDNKEN